MQTQWKRLVLLFTILLAVSATVYGQTFGEVTGHISDATGASIPGAKITFTNVATNAVRITASTDSGDYTFPAVAPGFYTVRVEQPSFKISTVNNVQVQVQQSLRLDFSLEVGQVTDSIEISASAQMLQAENVSLTTSSTWARTPARSSELRRGNCDIRQHAPDPVRAEVLVPTWSV